jgi:non-homologous end joining protein Ku
MLDEKSKGQEITVAVPAVPRQGQIIGLMQALKQSIEKAKPKPKAAQAQRKRKTLRNIFHDGQKQRKWQQGCLATKL